MWLQLRELTSSNAEIEGSVNQGIWRDDELKPGQRDRELVGMRAVRTDTKDAIAQELKGSLSIGTRLQTIV